MNGTRLGTMIITNASETKLTGSGKYITQNYSTSYWQPNGCKIRATLFNQVCYTIEDNYVYVDNDGNGNFIITFCDNFFSYSTTVFFPFRGRLVAN